MGKECYCKSFEGKERSPDEVLKKFKVLSISKSDNYHIPEDGEFTSLLKCNRCSSYYLLHVDNSLYMNKETVSIEKYNSDLDEGILINSLKNLEGMITSAELDEISKARSIMTNALKELKVNDDKGKN